MRRVFVRGAGFTVQDPERTGFKELLRDVAAAKLGNCISFAGAEMDAISVKDRRILSEDDIMATNAAELALKDAGIETGAVRDTGDDLGCIVFNVGKATRQIERTHPRVPFRKPDDSVDTLALEAAVASGQVVLDPLNLLKHLDNSVLWWLCKTHKIGGLNLQITQSDAPDLMALLEAVNIISHGECNRLLVGGFQTAEQSAIHLSASSGRFHREDDVRAGGGSIFFVLEGSDEESPPWPVRGELSSSLPVHDGARGPAAATVAAGQSPPYHYPIGAPGIVTFVELYRICQGIAVETPRSQVFSTGRSNGPTITWKPR